MFSRNSTAEPKHSPEPKPFDAFRPVPNGEARSSPPPVGSTFAGGGAAYQHAAPAAAAGFSLGSVIGNDLTIIGQGLRIITKGTLQVDGRVEGDVVGSEVVIGEKGEVTGVVSAESVIVRGRVNGTIKGLKVTLQSSARVEGDVHHQQLSVEQGAHLDGRVRRPADPSELKPQLDPTK